jgi:exodeoxyribonuclease VII large subunit
MEAVEFPAAPGRPERDIYSVSRLNREVRVLLERGFGSIWLEAEISNLSRPGSGHWYFSLKDANAQVRCAMFRQRNMLCVFAPRDGQKVLVRARIGLYEPRGEYQLIVDHMEDSGLGALKRQFEELRAKLMAEGLFAQERKRALPKLPRRIGVITSPTGAAVRDILHVLARRFPAASVLIHPVSVQGATAAAEIIAALGLAARRGECDVLILARGGGSLEDLWAFNDERLARAIAASPIPIVTGVGHEVDFTIADFAADVRAPTPSAAAELVVPHADEWHTALERLSSRLWRDMRHRLEQHRERLKWLAGRAALAGPRAQLDGQIQRVDELEECLVRAIRQILHSRRATLADEQSRLWQASPAAALRDTAAHYRALLARLRIAGPEATRRAQARLQPLSTRLTVIGPESARRARERFAPISSKLDALSPLKTLARGYAIVKLESGEILRDSGKANAGTMIEAQLEHGSVRARVERSS